MVTYNANFNTVIYDAGLSGFDANKISIPMSKEIKVNDISSWELADIEDDNKENLYALGGGEFDWLGDWILPNVRDYAITTVLNKAAGGFLGDWSIPGTVYTIAVTGIDAMERNYALNLCIDNSDLAVYVETLCIDANVIKVDGKVLLENVTYDYHTLQIRLGAYNKANGTNYSITELIKSAEAPNDEEHEKEKSLYKDFYNWYRVDGEGKTGKVAEYIQKLDNKYEELQIQYPELKTGFESLNYKQIQEIEKKIKNPSYEIDIDLWK